MNNEQFGAVNGFNAPGSELAEVDEMLEKAASLIDSGRYEEAIACFNRVVEMTRSIFGDKIELTEVHEKINEVQKLLLELKR